MPLADRLEITHVHARPEGDTYFPPIDDKRWRLVERNEQPAGPRDEVGFAYATYLPASASRRGLNRGGMVNIRLVRVLSSLGDARCKAGTAPL